MFAKGSTGRSVRVWAWRAGALAAVACAVVAGFAYFDDAKRFAVALLAWIEDLGAVGVATFVGLYIAAVILMLPGSILTLGGGFVFGFWLGSLLVVGSLAVGSGIAFLIARYAFGQGVARRLEARANLQALNRGLAREGWKLVALSRCLPGFPYKLSNYFFGLTAITFRDFFWANLVGVIPLSLTNVYIGAAAADLVEIGRQEAGGGSWALYAFGAAMAVAMLIVLSRLARRVWREAQAEAPQEGAGGQDAPA